MTGSDVKVMPWPEVDHSIYGEVERRPLGKIQKITGDVLSRNWILIPHVTHNDEADTTELDVARAALSETSGIKITALAYMVKAVVAALKAYPQFNASLDGKTDTLVLKKFFHIGIAVDTPRGLVVGVVRDCDRKSVPALAEDIGAMTRKAREKGLSMAEMSGGCITVSSLGALGGTSFTPIINAPEVAILGVSSTQERAVRNGDDIAWRKMTPLSLSYDHRVINGADAARFISLLKSLLADPAGLSA